MIYQSIQDCIDDLESQYDVVAKIPCKYDSMELAKLDLYAKLKKIHQSEYSNNQRLIFVLDCDFYNTSHIAGGILQALQVVIQDIDISNFFVCVVTTNPVIEQEYQYIKENVSWDSVPFNLYRCQGDFDRIELDYKPMDGKIQSLKHIVDVLDDLDDRYKDLLFVNKSLCMMPWVGLNIEPDSSVRPCCEFDPKSPIGNAKQNSIKEIWNSADLKQIRLSMLKGQEIDACKKCYHKETLKRDSLRNSINRDFAKYAHLLDTTNKDGSLDDTTIRYWDIRYNNLCNFACRSCGPESSSSWYQIHNDFNPTNKLHKPLLIAGANSDGVFDQICEDIDRVEKIYFAGGEPMIIENFYKILEILDSKNRHDVHLVYNTNLSKLNLKDRSILDLWKKFRRVSVGASLDAMGPRAEYLRTNTVWDDIERNRLAIRDQCPHVDFWVSATTGLINALHVVDFHKNWVSRGLIKVDDFNIQLLYGPSYMSVINAPDRLKQHIIETYESHLEWLKSRDTTGRAIAGFRSIIGMCQQPGHYDPVKFWQEVNRLDQYHRTDLLETFPELHDMGLTRP